jgi:membrane-associated protein
MNLPHFLSQIPQLTASFDPRTAAFLYAICAIGELGVSVPYILESVWLLAGYQLGAGVLSPVHLVGFWLAAQAGRQTGTMALYFITRLSSSPLARLYRKITSSRFWPKTPLNNNVLKRINLSSSFSLAYGRLVGLRFPLTIMLALQKKLAPVLTGVLLSSLVWDGIYITLGATVGRTAVLKPAEMLLASIATLTLLYLVMFLARRLFKRAQPASH